MREKVIEEQDYIPADDWVPVFLEILKTGKRMKISPHGYSMYPFLRSDQDEVILTLPKRPLKRGDVMLYRRDNGLHVLHRIHHINKEGYFMIGDSQSEIEGPLREDQMLAIMDAFLRDGKEISVKSRKYRFFATIWLRIRILRKPIIQLFHWFRQVTHTAK